MPDGKQGLDTELLSQVDVFAGDIHDVLTRVLPVKVQPLTVTATAGSRPHVVIQQSESSGVELTADGTPVLHLSFRFWCTWDSAGSYLAVRKSEVGVNSVVSDTPLFHYDYIAESSEDVASAHLNIHAHRDEVVFAMLAAGRTHRGKTRDYAVRKGTIPRVSSLHFPLGGHRFRPCLEDVLEFLIREFGLDTKDQWRDVLQTSRRTWRERQLKAAVRDDPDSAAAALRALGYSITVPEGTPARRLDRLNAL